MQTNELSAISQLLRYYILTSTTKAGSGHPSSCLSAVELMASLFFGGYFQFDTDNPNNPNNDRIIFSKGHTAPLLYSLWAVAGKLKEEELLQLRSFDSPLEGHPSKRFPFTEVATGSLGQGLGIGLGMALNAKYLDKLSYYTYVLLGDSEMAEGSNWEAIQVASYYKLHNLIGILDVNRLGQVGETMLGWDMVSYQKRLEAFGWQTKVIDGHDFTQIQAAYALIRQERTLPLMIIAKTIKGKGVSLLENKDNWHGKALSDAQLQQALIEIGPVNKELRMEIKKPTTSKIKDQKLEIKNTDQELKSKNPIQNSKFNIQYSLYKLNDQISTREAYGNTIIKLGEQNPDLVVLDAELSNSTHANKFKEKFPDRFFEMYIAEQNMVSTATGLALRRKIPFISTYGAFFTRAFDQIRMSQYSEANIKLVGSHAGVSIGADGPSQMGLEDIAMFRSILKSVVLYSCDAVSTEKLTIEAAQYQGLVYLRTTRSPTPVIYSPNDTFTIGGSKVLKQSETDQVTIVSAGITIFEALKAYEELQKQGISVRIIDLYSIKPLDLNTLKQAALQTKKIVMVEDHYPAGGLGEAVMSALADVPVMIKQLAVNKIPRSGTTEQLFEYEQISSSFIVPLVKAIL